MPRQKPDSGRPLRIIRGKACYLSPEQADCTELDGRSDLFSLGVVLYEVLNGLRPFEGDTRAQDVADDPAARSGSSIGTAS